MSTARQPFDHPAAWRATDFRGKDDFAIDLEPRHLDALHRALAQAKSAGGDPERLTVADFPLDDIAGDVAAWCEQVRTGRGLQVLRGFPVDQLSVADAGLMYFGLGLHLGRPVSQSNMGDLLGDVVNIGGQDPRERAYRNARELHLHTDRCDHVGMLCFRPAWKGGVSGYASALTIHNIMLEECPDLLEHLYTGYRHHRFGEQPPGEPPVTEIPIPIFSVTDGVPNVIYIRGYIDIAVDEGHISLSDSEREALNVFEAIADRPDVRLNFSLASGELALFNNCLVLHTRTAFEDHPEDATQKRHLMRLWLMEDGRPAAAGVRLHKGPGGIPKLEGKGTYYAGRKVESSQ